MPSPDQIMATITDSLDRARRELPKTRAAAQSLVQLGSAATGLAGLLSNPDATDKGELARLSGKLGTSSQVIESARQARAFLAQGDPRLTEAFDQSLAQVQTDVHQVTTQLQALTNQAFSAETRQGIVDTVRQLAGSASSAGNAVLSVLTQVEEGVGSTHRRVYDAWQNRA